MPGTYNLSTTVNYLDDVMKKYTGVEMHRSTTGLVGDLALFDTKTLVEGTIYYEFIDTAGEDNYAAAFRYHNDTGPLNSAFSPLIQYGTLAAWYVDIQDLRNEGIDATMLGNTRATKLIRMAQSAIDDATGRHFLPESKTLKVDSERMAMLVLPEPIVKIDSVQLEELVSGGTPTTTDYDVNLMRVYNRHLTQRLIRPDDREFPRVVITPEFVPDQRWTGNFTRTRQQMKVVGVFGYTELRPSDAAGETTDGSQVPLNYGRCPPLIADTMVRMITRWISPHGEVEMRQADEVLSRAKSWKTDKQAMSFHGPDTMGVPVITGDFEIDRVLHRYSTDYSPKVGIAGGEY